jgi:hypothetical protein
MSSFQMAMGAKNRAVEVLSARFPEISGVGVTRVAEGWGLKVNLRRPARKKLPLEVEGVPIVAEVVGDVVAD